MTSTNEDSAAAVGNAPMKSRQPSPSVRKPVFVIGCGRSGTTMLFSLLKAHPQLAATTGHPDGEDHVGWVRHGQAIIAGIYGNADTGDTGNVVGHACCLHMTQDDVTPEIREAMHRYYADDVLQNRSGLRVINKCPHLSNKVAYVKAIFPDAKFVHIVREPVAMVASWIAIMAQVPDLALYWPDAPHPCFWVVPRAGAMRQAGLMARDSRFYPGGGLMHFADYWASTNEGIVRQAEDFSSQIYTLRYEDLVNDPPNALAGITDFCELERLQSLPIAISKARNRERLDLLTDADVAEIHTRTGAVAGRFGYEALA